MLALHVQKPTNGTQTTLPNQHRQMQHPPTVYLHWTHWRQNLAAKSGKSNTAQSLRKHCTHLSDTLIYTCTTFIVKHSGSLATRFPN